MKSTKIMLAVIGTFLITWCSVGLIGYLLSSATYVECLIHPVTIMLMITFGIIPSIIVGNDIDDTLQ
jgi:hypothetical protein